MHLHKGGSICPSAQKFTDLEVKDQSDLQVQSKHTVKKMSSLHSNHFSNLLELQIVYFHQPCLSPQRHG